MLAHGLYAEHFLALLFGLVGLIVGVASVVKAARGSRHWGLFAGLAFGCATVAVICGAHSYGDLLTAFSWRLALESPDFRLCFVPSLALCLLGLLVGMYRRSTNPA